MTFCDFCRGRKQESTPDPGHYNVPSSFGSGPKYTMHVRHKTYEKDYAPQYNNLPSTLSKKGSTIGPKTPAIRTTTDTVPGPFYVSTTMGNGRKSAIHTRRRDPVNENPGPGSYDIPSQFEGGPSYSIGVGKRYGFIVDNTLVAPGTYDIPSDMAQRRPITMSGKAREPFRKKAHPGPIYDVQKSIGSDARKSAFPKGPRDMPIPKTPGPGDYNISDGIGTGSKIPPKLRSRHPEKEREVNQMPYYDIGTTIQPKKKSIGHRPVTSYETISPGPGYNIPTTIVPKPRTIGVRTTQKDPREDVPSPDSYWMSTDPPKPPPIVGFGGPIDRSIVNSKKEAEKPGPGYYESKSSLAPGKKGYKFGTSGRPAYDPEPDTAAPYHGCKSTLGGPMYTIGSKDA